MFPAYAILYGCAGHKWKNQLIVQRNRCCFVMLFDDSGLLLCSGYGGGMSSAKAALESDTRVLAFEAGRKYGVRVNSISAGPLGSRAAKAIGFIDDMIRWRLPSYPQALAECAAFGMCATSRHAAFYDAMIASYYCLARSPCYEVKERDTSKKRDESRACRLQLHLKRGACLHRYAHANAPIQKELEAREVGNVAAFLLSPLATAITGSVVYVDNGLNAMGLALDSKSLVQEKEEVTA